RQDRQTCEPEREGDRHAHEHQQEKQSEQDECRLTRREDGAHHADALPKMTRRSSNICSPRKTIQVRPVTGQATWMYHSGSSASSEMRFIANSVNFIPAVTKMMAVASTPIRPVKRAMASPRGPMRGQTSTSK